jgi:prepilin-type N-terminal cleavage/methylation domain-containing protein
MNNSHVKNSSAKGFTLAELLIVVAIIAVLVAIAIPIFNNRLEASREATDVAMLRQAYTAAIICQNSGKWDDGELIKTGDSNLYLFGVYNPVSGKCVSWKKKGTQSSAELQKATPKAKVQGWQGKEPDWNSGYYKKQTGMPGYEGYPTNVNAEYVPNMSKVKEIHVYFSSSLKLSKVYFGSYDHVY